MSLLWVLALASLVAAILAWRKARAAAHRAEQLSQLYWELKYQHGELRGQVQRLAGPNAGRHSANLDGGAGTIDLDRSDLHNTDVPTAPTAEGAGARPTDAFIPLSSLKR